VEDEDGLYRNYQPTKYKSI